MSEYMEHLKQDIDNILHEYAEKGVKNCQDLEVVKTALSAKSKILTIDAMERVSESGFGRNYGPRNAHGQFMDARYRDNDGNYRDSGREYLHNLMSRADPSEKEILEKLLHKL